jgi:hypothetical protein
MDLSPWRISLRDIRIDSNERHFIVVLAVSFLPAHREISGFTSPPTYTVILVPVQVELLVRQRVDTPAEIWVKRPHHHLA